MESSGSLPLGTTDVYSNATKLSLIVGILTLDNQITHYYFHFYYSTDKKDFKIKCEVFTFEKSVVVTWHCLNKIEQN